jgi:translation initiation factor IF-1
MPKNIKGGNKSKKLKNNAHDKPRNTPLPCEADNSHIAQITATLGECRFRCKIVNADGLQPADIMAHLPNSSKKYGFITLGAYVKISLRDFEVNKGDILYLYNSNDVEFLISNNYMVDVVEKSTGSGADDLIFSNINQDEINVETI